MKWWMGSLVAVVSLGGGLMGCSGEVAEENQGEEAWALPEDGCNYSEATERYLVGAWQVYVDEESGHWWVRDEENGGGIEAPGSCPGLEEGAQVRLSGAPRSRFGFGSFEIDTRAEDGSRWEAFGGGTAEVLAGEEGVRLIWQDGEGEEVALVFSAKGERDLSIRVEAEGERLGEVGFSCREGESFFGLGTQVVGMDLRGRTYPLWTQEQGNGKSDDPVWPLENVMEAAYAPMGVWHSSRGYAALVGHDGFHELDLCAQEATVGRLRSYPDMPEMVLVGGATAKERMSGLTEYTGRLTGAPDWMFGPWNDAVSGPERVRYVAEHLRANGIPSSAMWTEDWIGGEVTPNGFRLSYRWEWDEETYPALPAMIEELQAEGYAFLAYFNSFVPTSVPRYEEAVEEGYLIGKEDGEVYLFQDPAFRNASMVDLTSEAARAWTLGYMRRAVEELKIDGWMLDFGEWLPTDARLASGESAWRVHNQYPTIWQEISRAALEGVRTDGNWAYFARSGWASAQGGTPGIAPALWGGDQNTDWGRADGLPSVVPIGMHAGMSGVAIYGSDIGGYSSLLKDNTDKELFLRWAAVGAFHPLMRTHHGGDKCNNWMYDSDVETMEAYRRYARIHTLMLPYYRGLRREAVEEGWPMVRHPYLVEEMAGEPLWRSEEYQYFLGDDVLVAPVLEEGATSREVVLPGGSWWPIFGEEALAGGERIEVVAGYSEIPVFVRGGRLVPLLGRWVDSFYGSSVEGVTDLDDVAGEYRVALYPDEEGHVAAGEVGESLVWAQGLEGEVDWREARVNGEALEACGEEKVAPCSEEGALYVRSGEVEIAVGEGRIVIEGAGGEVLRLGVGREAWEDVAQAPVIGDLDPPFTSYCEE